VGLSNVSAANLIQYAAAEKKVTIVGPSTLSAMLQTIVQGLRSLEIHKDTEKIRQNIEQLGRHLVAHNAYMLKLGNSLGTTVGHYNTTYKELGKIDKDIVKITDKAPDVEPLALERPNQKIEQLLPAGYCPQQTFVTLSPADLSNWQPGGALLSK